MSTYKNGNGDKIYSNTPYGDLPSVTTILDQLDKSGPLMGWAIKTVIEYMKSLADAKGHILITKDEAQDIFRKARAYHKELQTQALELGSEAHNLIEVYIKGQKVDGLLEANPKLKPSFEAFLDWQNTHKFKFISTERMVCSPLKYAGTLDAIAEKDGKLWVIDFKTSKTIYDEHLWQVAAYKTCVEDGMYWDNAQEKWVESELEIDGGVGVLRLDKVTGIPEWKGYSLMDSLDAFDCFMSLCHLWHLRKARETKCK